jgi:hypothetical protein
VLKEKLGFCPCKTSAWQNTMVPLLLDPRFPTAPQLTKMVRSSITATGFTLKKIVNSRLDRLPFLGSMRQRQGSIRYDSLLRFCRGRIDICEPAQED